MDLNSPEFYTLAFVVAMALVAMLMGTRDKGQASTHIFQLVTSAIEGDDESADDDKLLMRNEGNGKVLICRQGMTLGDEETINLVFTIRDDECNILEKKGVKRRGVVGVPVQGQVTVKCLRPIKYRVRYESQVTSRWASFTFDVASSQEKQVPLNY
jgi:hypothetical protein